MQWLHILALTVALATAALGQNEANDDNRLPGTIRFAAIEENQAVLLDGERVGSGSRLARELMVAPGTYVVTVIDTANRTACNLRVRVRENQETEARCAPDNGRRLAD